MFKMCRNNCDCCDYRRDKEKRLPIRDVQLEFKTEFPRAFVDRVKTIEGVEELKPSMTMGILRGRVDPETVQAEIQKLFAGQVKLVPEVPPCDNSRRNALCNKFQDWVKRKEPKEWSIREILLLPHCECKTCIKTLSETIFKAKGTLTVTPVSAEEKKLNFIVRGALDMQVLAKQLSEKLNKNVEIVVPTNEEEKEEDKVEKKKEQKEENKKEEKKERKKEEKEEEKEEIEGKLKTRGWKNSSTKYVFEEFHSHVPEYSSVTQWYTPQSYTSDLRWVDDEDAPACSIM